MLFQLLNAHTIDEQTEKVFCNKRMLSNSPALSNFLLVLLLPFNNIYNIFKVELMHTFSLRISSTLKEFMCIKLKYNEKLSISVS